MYLMRVDSRAALLRIECSGEVVAAEALRAVSQAAALAEAGNIWALAVDVSQVERWPTSGRVVAAAMAGVHRDGLRVAWITPAAGCATVERLARLAGLQDAFRTFDSEAAAAAWLDVARERVALSGQTRPSSGSRRAPALTAGGPSAA